MRRWLVTGASRGIGRAVTEELLVRGHHVVATARQPEALAPLVRDHDGRLVVEALDVTDPSALRLVVDRAFAAPGGVDVVLSNAGYGLYGAVEESDDDQIARLITTNLVGPVHVARSVTPRFREQGGGHLIQMSSMAGHFGHPGLALYHASKWGVEGFFESFSREVEPFGIRTTVLAPGRFPTGFFDAAERPAAHEAYATDVGIPRASSEVAPPGSLEKLVSLIVSIGGADRPPRRLLLGSDAYANAHEALTARLDDLERNRHVAMSTDA